MELFIVLAFLVAIVISMAHDHQRFHRPSVPMTAYDRELERRGWFRRG